MEGGAETHGQISGTFVLVRDIAYIMGYMTDRMLKVSVHDTK